MKTYFVTGTDTDAGKTLVAEALLHKARQQGLVCYGLKPVAAGAEIHNGEASNSDAVKLQNAASVHLPYAVINPYLFNSPIAPHIAAEQSQTSITQQVLVDHIRQTLIQCPADLVVVEGAGGWLVPINAAQYLSGIALDLQLEVIVVVGLKLGCLNHALLTVRAIEQDGLKVAAWVGSQIEADMPVLTENIATLTQKIVAPCLGIIPHQAGINGEQAAKFINLPT
jgi:dethiobiotin synthetase